MSIIDTLRAPPIQQPLWIRVGFGALAGVSLWALIVAVEWLTGSIDRGTTRDGGGLPVPVEPLLRNLAFALPATGAVAGLLLPLYRTKIGAAAGGALSIVPLVLPLLPKLWHLTQMLDVWRISGMLVLLVAFGAVTALGVRPAVLGTGEAQLGESPLNLP